MHRKILILVVSFGFVAIQAANGDNPASLNGKLIAKPEAFKTLVNPACSHCVDEAKRRAGELRDGDRVLCWIRGYSEGGAIPYRFFLNPYRVISDTYGVFVYDPDAGYARGFAASLEFRFHGWRNGVMVMKHKDGTLYSCLSGVAFDGPQKGTRLRAVPTLVSDWGAWTQRYPRAVAYQMFEKYQPVELPTADQEESRQSRGPADKRLPADTPVLGVAQGGQARAYPLDVVAKAGLVRDLVDGQPRILLWYGPTKTAAAYQPLALPPKKDGGKPRPVTLEADTKVAAAPFIDKETGSRWDIAGRATAGELQGWTLTWLDGTQVKWFAWAAEYPQTDIYAPPARPGGDSAAPPEAPAEKPRPKTGGTDNDPLIQLEVTDLDRGGAAEALLAALNQLPWASRTAVLPKYPGIVPKGRVQARATAVVALGERQWADIADLLRRARAAGATISAAQLTDFGTVRIHTRFGPLGGETVEVGEGKQKRLVLAPGNPARQGIEAAFRKAPWLADAHYTGAGTKPDFALRPDQPEVRIEFHLRPGQLIEIGTLLDALGRAGCPPVSMRVARMGAGVPFGFPIPKDVELVDGDGVSRWSGQLQKAGRPLVLVFFPLQAKFKQGKEERAYHAEPAHFTRLKEVAQKFADRVDFVAVSGRKEDAFADAVALWQKADMPFPILHDPAQKLATALSAGLTHPPPHIFIVDADGQLRYAGDFADGWVEPEKIKRVYLVEALERVLAKKYSENGAVFFNSPLCDCSAAACKCPKCGCGGACRCGCSTGGG